MYINGHCDSTLPLSFVGMAIGLSLPLIMALIIDLVTSLVIKARLSDATIRASDLLIRIRRIPQSVANEVEREHGYDHKYRRYHEP